MKTGMKRGLAVILVFAAVFFLSLASVPGRSPTQSDAEYANFRNVRAGSIGANILFRSQHPANGSSRGKYANELTEANEIQTVLNLSDSKSSLEKYFIEKKIGPKQYYRTLYSNGKVYTAHLNPKHTSSAYRKNLAASLKFLAKNRGPYLIHCEVGRDRTGFAMLLLESLMGASYSYMLKDYALSFVNVNRNSYEKAQKKAAKHLAEEFSYMTGKSKKTNWRNLNLSAYAANYLKKGGMTAAEILALKKNLSMSYGYGIGSGR